MKLLIGLAFTLVAGLAQAQSFPNKPLRFVVPFPPGGGTDILGRALGAVIGESVGQTVIVENRPGANGAVGSDHVAKSAPDGYTVGFAGSSTHVLNPLLYKLNYDPVKDFTPVSVVANTSLAILVNPASATHGYKTLGELLAYARSNLGKLSYASFGNAGAGRPHGGADPAHVLSGRVRFTFVGGGPGGHDPGGDPGPSREPHDLSPWQCRQRDLPGAGAAAGHRPAGVPEGRAAVAGPMNGHGTEAPSDWVRRWAPLIRSGTVLDLACGAGATRAFSSSGVWGWWRWTANARTSRGRVSYRPNSRTAAPGRCRGSASRGSSFFTKSGP